MILYDYLYIARFLVSIVGNISDYKDNILPSKKLYGSKKDENILHPPDVFFISS